MFGYPVENVVFGVILFAVLAYVGYKFIYPRLVGDGSSSGVGGKGPSGPKPHRK